VPPRLVGAARRLVVTSPVPNTCSNTLPVDPEDFSG
jgi:hypothetical protein